MKNKTKQITLISLFIALSVIGANIKISGTIAFDSLSAFLAGLVISPFAGGIVGVIGHLFSALFVGLPLGIITHLLISLSMFFSVYFFAKSYILTKNIFFAIFLALIFNGPFALLLVMPIVGFATTKILLLPVLVVCFINSLFAFVVYRIIKHEN